MKNSPHDDWREVVAETILYCAFEQQVANEIGINSKAGTAFQAFHMDAFWFNRPCWNHAEPIPMPHRSYPR